jgi:hypothetical protein
MRRIAVAGVLALALAACTASQAYRVTGESLVAMGNEFAVTAETMNRGLDAHSVSPEQYDAWRAFALRFKALYPRACDTYRDALEKSDAVKRDGAAALLSSLSFEMQAWQLTYAADGGAP